MKISTKGRYALRIMADLASYGKDEYISLTDISRRQELSLKYLESIVADLTKAGFLDSRRGKSGGYKLAKSASDYTIYEIFQVTEGIFAPVACLDGKECHRLDDCLTMPLWKGLQKHIDEYLQNVTLEDLINKNV